MTPSPPTTRSELLGRAHALAGQSLGEIAKSLEQPIPGQMRQAKGWAGQLLEHALGADAASLAEPDFRQLQIEMKTLPINSRGQPKESTYVCVVPLRELTHQTWESSWVRRKLQTVLWVPLEGDPQIPLPQRRVGNALLWQPSPEQEAVLRQDWEELTDMLCMGQIDQISARHGTYLQIRPKAANSMVLTTSTGTEGDLIQTLPRGFYLRSRFTQQILREHYIT